MEIEGVQYCSNLKNLSLSFNNISKISGLDGLPIKQIDLVKFYFSVIAAVWKMIKMSLTAWEIIEEHIKQWGSIYFTSELSSKYDFPFSS